MNPRERRLAMIFGSVFLVGAAYYGIRVTFVDPVIEARATYEKRLQEQNELQKLIRSEDRLARRWNADAGRTFSFDVSETQSLFGQRLKDIAKRYGFETASFKPRKGRAIGRKTGISTVIYHISAEGEYARLIDLLDEIGESPYLCQVTSLNISAPGPRVDRDRVTFDLTVETPVLPKIGRRDIKIASKANTMSVESEATLGPFRRDFADAESRLVLDDRNIFRWFMPPPTRMVMIDNQDFKTVAVLVKFLWEGREEEQLTETIAGMSQKSVSGKGNVMEITGSYADGKAFGPKRIDFSRGGEGVYVVASHTPPPADTVILAVDNRDDKDVIIKVVVTTQEGRAIKPPPMLIAAKRVMDLGEWRAKQVQVTSKYHSDKPGPVQNYKPGTGKQTLLIPGEAEIVAVRPGNPAPTDPPPDGKYTVTGLWTYPGAVEMIVTAGGQRKIITPEKKGAVDGGTLLAVHPLGGVVEMPSGKYYFYPLSRSYTDRVLLDAREEAELGRAIDAWTRR